MDEIELYALAGALRILGLVFCAYKAKKLNRDPFRWGFFGLIIPVLAIIWILFMKPVLKHDEDIKIK